MGAALKNVPGGPKNVLYKPLIGDTSKLVELLLDGYDHITDIVDADDTTIIDHVAKENQPETVSFLQSILTFEVNQSKRIW